MKLALLYSRIRAEEKLLIQALIKRRLDFELLSDRNLLLTIPQDPAQYDIMLARSMSHARTMSCLRVLNDAGVRTVNTARVAAICGDKLLTTSALTKANIPSPQTAVAYTPQSALQAMEEIGYPVVVKPVVGSWGRLLGKIHDRTSAEAILEHKHLLGSDEHSIFYIQKFIDKPMRDIRAFVIGDQTICAIYRNSPTWITNTARAADQVIVRLRRN